jgi:hypothetical protein
MAIPRPALLLRAALLALVFRIATPGAEGAEKLSAQLARDPLLDESFLSLPLPALEIDDGEAADAPASSARKPRVGLLRLRSQLDETRVEHLWRLRSTNPPVIDFPGGYRRSGPLMTCGFFDPYWHFGPESGWWIVHGPGTVQRRDAEFPEFGRHHPAAFFRAPGTLPVELLKGRSALLCDDSRGGAPGGRDLRTAVLEAPPAKAAISVPFSGGERVPVPDRGGSLRRAER